jgi:hypothetical protein
MYMIQTVYKRARNYVVVQKMKLFAVILSMMFVIAADENTKDESKWRYHGLKPMHLCKVFCPCKYNC